MHVNCIYEKSDVLSDKFRKEGNAHYQKKSFFKALQSYNKSINYSHSRKNIALGLANRSAIFLELKRYKECFADIKLAREYDYPAEKLQKLNLREEKCKKLIEEHPENPLDPIIRFFKPTYTPNSKIPFITNKVILLPECGIYAIKDIEAGEILAVEKSVMCVPAESSLFNRCFVCGYARFDLMVNPLLNYHMFCSKECCDKFGMFQTPHADQVEMNFGGRSEILRFFGKFNIKTMNKTVFDFNFNNENHPNYKDNLMRCVVSFSTKFSSPSFDKLEPHHYQELMNSVKSDQRLLDFTKTFATLMLNSGYTLEGVEYVNGVKKSCSEGYLLFPFYNLITHSCIPNVANIVVNNTSFLYATQPIKATEELFYHFLDNPKLRENLTSPEDVEGFLSLYRNYECECYYCTKNASLEDLPMGYNDDIQQALIKSMMLDFTVQNSSQIVRQLRENFKIIRDHADDALTRHVQILKLENRRIIKLMGELWSYSCTRDD